MDSIRKIAKTSKSVPTMEGAGVRLKRAFGFEEPGALDPFLLLDEFHSHDPQDYMAGFPYHPHRGIETVTYMIAGEIEHADNLGNRGVIGPGDIQWMTAGSGIIHQEMPKRQKDEFRGSQLWINLPAARKTDPPKYQPINKDQIPVVRVEESAVVKVICGEFRGVTGPAVDVSVDPQYFDIRVGPDVGFAAAVKAGYTVFAYVLEGSGFFDDATSLIGPEHLVVFNDGESVEVTTGDDEGVRFLLVSGRPIGEPIA